MFVSHTSPAQLPVSFFDRRGARDRRAAVRDMEARLAALEQVLPMLELAADGTVLDANPPLAALLATAPETLRGQKLGALLIAAEVTGTALVRLLEHVGRGVPVTVDLRLAHGAAGMVTLRLTASPLPGENGAPHRAVVLAADVSDAIVVLHAQQALESTSAAVMMVNRDFKVTYVNRTTQELLKRNADNFRKIWPFRPGADRGHVHRHLPPRPLAPAAHAGR
ncbi:PAS domain-containing protein [Paeniroseomonas aquatica]|uniref:PAS domain-containing protein n=1 Tax=Paeniroseomonas aquatica TaxID=373043 RepID=UPI00360E2522